ncbi:MAG: MFS transporter [Burkholderiaceae bacterium]
MPAFEHSPLRHRPYRWFYFGAVGTALGFTMVVTMSAWLMASLTPAAWMVALVQTAATLPTLLFGLFAGALADIVDRRRVILVSQFVLLLTTLGLGGITLLGLIQPVTLLLLTFIVGAGFAFYMPAQMASVNELVEPKEVSRAVALGAVAFNVSRAIGPALAGGIASLYGSGSALLAGGAFFSLMIIGMHGWSLPPRSPLGVPETLLAGVKSGLRFARHSSAIRALIVRTLVFSICASALWALLPVIARDQLGMSAAGYGAMFGMFGSGAVVSAFIMPKLLNRYPLNTVVTGYVLLWIVATLVVAASHIVFVAMIGSFAAGGAWVGVLASLGAGTQSAAPGWVRARAVSLGLLAVQASLAIGSAMWGALASITGTQVACAVSALLLMILHLANRASVVKLGSEAETTSFASLPDLAIAVEPLPDDGPVLVQIEYFIEPERQAEFFIEVQTIEPTRRRNGASDWRIFRDLSTPGRFVERFVITSWAEYIRSRLRMTIADRRLQEKVMKMNRDQKPVRVSRLIGIDPRTGH